MKVLKQLAAASIVTLLLSTQVYADSLALRFLGTGDIKPLADTLMEIGVDLKKDTNLSGTKIAELESSIAGCWAVPMVDPASEIPLGTGIDCLRPLNGAPDSQGDGISLEALSFFVFDSGTIITLGLTSVRPFRDGGIGDAGGDVTHITGSIPNDKTGVIGGTGAFADSGGAARVSGAVYLGEFPGKITFDCLWIVGVEDGLANKKSSKKSSKKKSSKNKSSKKKG
jgi:hypothetical protein